MAQQVTSHLPNIHEEAAEDETDFQRPRNTSQEELASPSTEAFQDCNQSPTGAQSGAIPLVVQGSQKKATFKEPPGDDFIYHRPSVAPSRRSTHQMQRVSVFDWDPSGRQRSVGHDRMRFEDYLQAKESLGKDSHPGYDDNQQDRRFSEYRGRDSYPLGRMPPRGSMYSKFYELEEGHDNGSTPPRALSPEIPLRLPWTMWMNSSAKNCKFLTGCIVGLRLMNPLRHRRVCRRVCGYNDVSFLCLCRNSGRKYCFR